jgi:O-antigen/teichoic acid export membrane protein
MLEGNSYRHIIKATSLFGGVQVINIVITIIRSKIIAVLLGPTGMGITGLLTTTIGLVSSVTNFGLASSAVKEVAGARAAADPNRITVTISVFQWLIWITGLLGTSVVLLLAPWLSRITFGNRDFTWAFIWISITLLFNQLSSEHYVILQGLNRLKDLAKAGVIGSLFSLIFSVPLYFFFGINGIAPAMVVASVISYIVAYSYGRKIFISRIKSSWETILREGKGMMIMGFVLTVNGFVLMGSSYLIRIFIGQTGGIADVGLYSAGFAIINSYVGMVFTAMVTDYYPRLAALASDNVQFNKTVNQQAEITLLILGPIILVFIIFIKIFVILLLSNQFVAVTGMLLWAMLGILFKAASWPLGFIFISKGDSKVALISELLANGYMLLLNMLGYYFFGIDGLGVAFLIGYALYLFQVFIIARLKYEFSYTPDFYKIFLFQFSTGIICLGITKMISAPWSYLVGLFFIAVSLLFSYRKLDDRIGMREAFLNFQSRFKRKN